MRMIDADVMHREIDKYDPEGRMSLKNIKRYIDAQPTAYDVEKIVKIFEEKSRNCQNNAKYYGEKAEWMSRAYRDAIEVVKGGARGTE